jgi:hypothetical protein
MHTLRAVVACAALLCPVAADAEEEKKEQPKGIEDNSFLMEEAYNQEPRVVQHISVFQYFKDKSWTFTFTQEWPLWGQAHQLSFMLPVAHIGDPSATGLGDIAINYRYQLFDNDFVAMAPRLTLFVPTGDSDKGTGKGAAGGQAHMAISAKLSERFVSHWNFGVTVTPNEKGPGTAAATTAGINYGTSLVWLVHPRLNFMLEAVGTVGESVLANGEKERGDTFFLNPGVRFAFNFDNGLQIVPGFSVPIGLAGSVDQWAVLGYLSFEHGF